MATDQQPSTDLKFAQEESFEFVDDEPLEFVDEISQENSFSEMKAGLSEAVSLARQNFYGALMRVAIAIALFGFAWLNRGYAIDLIDQSGGGIGPKILLNGIFFVVFLYGLVALYFTITCKAELSRGEQLLDGVNAAGHLE